jgi:alpha-1,2-mannosyltransferase
MAGYEEDPSVQAQAELDRTDAPSPFWSRQVPWHRILRVAALILAAAIFVAAFTAYLADATAHPRLVIDWYDLNVYNDAGLITRQLPSILYTWELKVGVQFTYTPFAAILFAGGSLMPMVTLRWLMTSASLISIPLTAWLTLGAMGRRGLPRAGVTLAVAAVALWIEPVIKALFLGQIELVLMLLIVWDLTRSDERWWKGAGIGLAAGIKLVPLIFIPYLLLSGKLRQAAVAAASFAATIVIGFAALPGPSAAYWLTGYFMRPGRTGGVRSLVNQSLLGTITRQVLNLQQGQALWLPITIAMAIVGLVAAAMLTRAGHAVPGWMLVAVTAVLVSPISWDHHWVWMIPFFAMLAGLAMRSRLPGRIGYTGALVLTAGVLGSWPWNWSGPDAFVPRRGLLGWFVRPPEVTHVVALHGWKLLTWNLFVAVGCVIYLVLLACAWPAWRNRPRSQAAAGWPPNPISALLARADTVLKGARLPQGRLAVRRAPAAGDRGGQPAAGPRPVLPRPGDDHDSRRDRNGRASQSPENGQCHVNEVGVNHLVRFRLWF